MNDRVKALARAAQRKQAYEAAQDAELAERLEASRRQAAGLASERFDALAPVQRYSAGAVTEEIRVEVTHFYRGSGHQRSPWCSCGPVKSRDESIPGHPEIRYTHRSGASLAAPPEGEKPGWLLAREQEQRDRGDSQT